MKICIIKLGAKGDVIRTLSILPAIKKKFPSSEITWITKDNVKEVFINNPYVDKVVISGQKISDNFDIIYSLDFDKEASDLALSINAKEKKGFFVEEGYPVPFNIGAEYYINTSFDDELKKNNKKTVQEMMFMASELEYEKDFCPIFLSDDEKKYGENRIRNFGLSGKKIIGIHIGASSSSQWQSRFWTDDFIIDFIRKAKKSGFEILLFGSPKKEEKLIGLVENCAEEGIKVYTNDVRNTDREYFSLVNVCSMMITPDSFAQHVSLALKKPTICLYFCTSPDEIESYGILEKVVSPILYDFFPEKMDQYSEDLMRSISPEMVLDALLRIESKHEKIKSFDEIAGIARDLKNKNKKIVWTSGCFDILHPGHTRYLKNARAYGDCFIVGLNSDSSVKLLKGQNRPINSEIARAEILSSLSFVDYIFIFSESSPKKYLETLKPDFYIKGGDYNLGTLNQEERKAVEGNGGKIIILNLEGDFSTTKIINKIAGIYRKKNEQRGDIGINLMKENPKIRGVVNAIIRREDGKFLVVKRKNEGINANKWAFPGGTVEIGEMAEETLRREIAEEVGLDVKKIVKKISEYSYPRADGTITKGECFFVETKNFEVDLNHDELDDFKWIFPQDLKSFDYISGMDKELILACEIQNK